MPEPKKLAVGMLLLGNFSGKPGDYLDCVWTVSKVRLKSATIIAQMGVMEATATLKCATVPEGWRVLHNASLAHLVLELEAEGKKRERDWDHLMEQLGEKAA